MELKVETITPKKAEQYLGTNYENQRHLNQNSVLQIADAMDHDEFDGLNGDTIKFKKNGNGWVLVDGQHRLEAVGLCGKPIKMAVLRGVSNDGFITLDQGRRRNVVDYYQIANQNHPQLSSQVGKWIYYDTFGSNPLVWTGKGKTPLPGRVAEWCLENCQDIPNILDEIMIYLSEFQKIGCGTKAHLGYVYYKWRKLNAIDAYNMAKFFGSGEGDVSHLMHSARNLMLSYPKQESLPGTKRGVVAISMLNIAWNERHNKRARKFKCLSSIKTLISKVNEVSQGAHIVPVNPK